MIIYDIESLHLSSEEGYSWDRIEELGMGTCVTYNSKTDLYKFWDQYQKEELIRYMIGNLCVSFNGHHFDEVVLNGPDWRRKNLWYAYDLKNEITKQIFNVVATDQALEFMDPAIVHGGYGLNAICRKTLGIGKNDDSIDMPRLIREERYKKVFEYNLQDVRLLKQLLEHITKKGYIITGKGFKKKIFISEKIWDY